MPDFSDFHFLTPIWLLALVPLAVLVWLAWRGGRGSAAWRRVVEPRLLAALTVPGGADGRRLPLVLLMLGWLGAVIALANPTLERKPVPAFRTDAARVIVLDLSRSMLAADLTPTRLERARYKVADILAADDEAQVGLIAFAGESFTVAPLSDDAETIRNMLDALSPELMPVQGSRPDLAIAQAQDLLEQAGARSGEVVLLTDDAGDERARAAAERLRAAGHRLAVIGVGTDTGAAVPGVRRADGPVIARLDPPALRRLAAAGGGAYARLSAGPTDLKAVLAEPGRAIRPDQDPRQTEAWKPLGPWVALVLLPLGAAAFRRGWLLVLAPAALPMLFLLPGPAMALDWDDLWQRRDQQAQQALTAGDPARARELAEDPARRGSALYRLGDYEAAAAAFDEDVSAAAHYNRGNALAQAGQLEDALTAYDEALRLEPDLADARHNREQVEKALRQRQAQQSQQDAQRQPGDQDQPSEEGDRERSDQQQEGAGQESSASQQGPGDEDGQSQRAERQQPQGQQGDGGSGSRQDAAQGDPQSGDSTEQQAGSSPRQSSAAAADQGTGAEGADREAAKASSEQATEQPRDAGAPAPDGAETAAAQRPDRQQEEQVAADYRREAAGARPQAAGSGDDAPRAAAAADLTPEQREAQQAADQWLRRIPDDPAGLLRRKFLYQYRARHDEDAEVRAGNPW